MTVTSPLPHRPLARLHTRPVLLTVVAVLLVGLAGSAVLAAVAETPAVHAGLIWWLALSYAASGLIAWWRRPANRIGPLMVLTGVCVIAATLIWSLNPVLHTIGQALDVLPLVMFVHVYLAFPAGRLENRLDRLLVGLGYGAAIGAQLVAMVLGGLGSEHLLGVIDAPIAAERIHQIELLVISAVAIVGVGRLVARRRIGGRPLRRSLDVVVDCFAAGLVTIAVLLLMGAFDGPAFPTVQRVSLALIGLGPIAFLAGLIRAELARSAVGALVMELRAEPVDLVTPLARALRDPSMSLVYWLPQFGSWADQTGQPVDLPSDRRRVTLIEHDGQRLAALIHDPALREEPELLDAVSAAAAIALQTGRLQAELRANVDELRGSRARVIEAGQKERQRLERDLHDGAQQRLVALSLDLGVLQTSLDADANANAVLTRARTQIAESLAELRDLARGLHPAVLSSHGLPVALETLIAQAAVPVHLAVRLDGRPDEPVEVAAYYVVCESLTNIGKHAAASSASVDIHRADGQIVVEIVDDGIGGADTERGTGLRGLADRVEALGGRLRVWTPRGGGTRVRAELPCG